MVAWDREVLWLAIGGGGGGNKTSHWCVVSCCLLTTKYKRQSAVSVAGFSQGAMLGLTGKHGAQRRAGALDTVT